MKHPSFSVFSPIAITYALAGLIVWLTATFLLRNGRRQASLPPGPRPWPIIGNLNLVDRLLHRSLHNLSETYGPLMRLKFGSSDVVVINTPEMAQEIMKTHDSSFAARPRLAAGKHLLYNFSDILSGNGPHWREGRKIFFTHLFSSKRLESYEYIRMEERRDFLMRLYDLRGKDVRIQDHLSRINLSIMSRIVLGKNYFSGSKLLDQVESSGETSVSQGEMQEMFDELFRLLGAFVIGDWIPWLARVDLGGEVKKMKNLNKKFDRFFSYIIKERKMVRNARQKERLKDMMDVLLDLVDDPDLEVKLTTDNVKAFTLDLLAGGTDTSSTTLEWAMAELMKHPEKINKATEELDRIIGQERWVEEKDIPNLPYLDAITKETFRLHPAGTIIFPHVALQDCQIKSYDISKGTAVFLNIWSMGRNPAVWDTPHEFRPERFLDKAVDIKGQNFELLPFGSGRRMCPGYTLGLKMIQSTLANMLHGFNWMLPHEMKPQDLDMDETYGLTTPRKHPLVAVVEPRLPPHLYTSKYPSASRA